MGFLSSKQHKNKNHALEEQNAYLKNPLQDEYCKFNAIRHPKFSQHVKT